jgi:plastocyanin
MHHRLAGIVLFFLALSFAGCSDNSNPSSPSGATPDVVITIMGNSGGMSYSPASATAKVGQTVAWKNNDSITHTATDDNGAFNTGNIAAGATSNPIAMMTAGTSAYHCTIHPTMTGTLTVSQ